MRSPIAPLAALLVCSLPGASCGGAPRSAETAAVVSDETLPDAEGEGPSTWVGTDRLLRTGEPVTLRLAPGEELLEMIRGLGTEAADPRFLRLTLDGMENPLAPVAVRVFVATPGAGPSTPIETPGYVADVGFFPSNDDRRTGTGPEGIAYLLDLGSALAGLPPEARLVEDRFLDVTLIAVPLGEDGGVETVSGVEIPFAGVGLTTHGGG